ncbi:MAG: Re/Si-specific NAD(P)(+) transhydrogenase subunit alpha [Gammaproteobacteria bacterium]|nr:Re/Si-specific NAD(P)(+) transhydrogenase subunit alpha [Gammaproteobacteria bacterium]MYD75670.1 Re/Si-specific NAD(P)(+) transhydrogenase subunit alpha [Gammaproteobacteria bacterium]MYJ51883.1 Re/Si-specific NAD(P)(+) transhydrogenase subunit alpha [Gammaproteobacteria bacterium]
MIVGIPKEVTVNEKRVACTPSEARRISGLGYAVLIETGAGESAGFSDPEYAKAGAEVCPDARSLWDRSDIVCKIQPPGMHPEMDCHESTRIRDGKTLICLYEPAQREEMTAEIAGTGGTVLALDAIPRISRAQKMDVLSSMANIAGYRAVLEAGNHFGRFFTGQITAAGKIAPAKVLVIGAGVAGLSAIGAAVSLGAIVRAFDTRPEVKDQIESMNAEFLDLEFEEEGGGQGGYAKVMSDAFIEAEMALFAEQAREVDIIITTALIPGRPAPKLITAEMVRSMRTGSVIVDLAAQQGGNCELTVPDEVVCENGVTIIGYTDLTSRMANQASTLYAANIFHLLSDLTPGKDGNLVLDLEDDIVRGSAVVKRGEILWPPPPIEPTAAAPAPAPEPSVAEGAVEPPRNRTLSTLIGLGMGTALILAVGSVAPASFMTHFTVFVLACFIGWQVIWNVTPALHTPLMSVTNAISGIILIGAMLQVDASSQLAVWLAIVAVTLASINVAGGFLVTQRMLRMFRKE